MQSALYSKLANALAPEKVIVEPTWTINGKTMIPDLVTIKESRITNIFELKFVPQGYVDFKSDLRKLLTYATSRNERHPIRLNPSTGQWKGYGAVKRDCEMHFVVIAKHDAAAVWAESLKQQVPELTGSEVTVNHWYGRIGAEEKTAKSWGIDFCI
jgi:hypothetical protein